MGCQSLSATLFWLIEHVLHGIPSVNVYCDDLVVFNRTEEEHLMVLDAIFRRCHKYRIKLVLDKGELTTTQITFLGFIIEKTSIGP